MPIAKFQMPDGSIGRFEVPEGTTPEQAQSMIQEYVSSSQGKAATQQQPSPQQEQTQSFGDELKRQLGLTVRSAGEGAAGTVGIFSDPIANVLNKFLPPEHQATMAKETISNLLTRAGVPEPQTETEKLVGQAGQAVTGAAGFTGIGKALAGTATPAISRLGKALEAAPSAQLGGSAASGAAMEKIRQEGGGIGWQILGGLGAGIAGGGLGSLVAKGLGAGQAAETIMPQAVKEAEQVGIPVMTSDIRQPQTFGTKWLQSAGEKLPLGTGGSRAAQQESRIDAVKNILREYGATEAAGLPDDIMKDVISKRSADLTKYSSMKGDVINGLGNAGNVPVIRTVKAIDDQISQLTSLRSKEYAPVISKLQDWKDAIQGQNLPNLELLRKQMGEAFSAPDLAAVRSTGEKSLSSIYGAMKQDMGDFIKYAGDPRDFTKWNVANSRLSGMADDLNMSAFKSLLNKGKATPEDVDKMLFSRKPSEVQQLYKSLTPDGRAVAQARILSKAAENAIPKGGTLDDISPEKYSTAVKQLGKSVGVFFKNSDLQRVEGLQRALALTKRAAEAGVAPPTGVQNWYAGMGLGGAVLASAAGGGAPGVAAAVTAGGGTVAAARIYESAPVRNLLIKLSQAPVGSELESALARRLNETIRAKVNQEESK